MFLTLENCDSERQLVSCQIDFVGLDWSFKFTDGLDCICINYLGKNPEKDWMIFFYYVLSTLSSQETTNRCKESKDRPLIDLERRILLILLNIILN